MKKKVASYSTQFGFTLLELLIALLLTGLIAILVFGGMNIGIRSWEKVESRSEQMSEAFITQQFIRKQLVSAVGDKVASLESGTLVMAFLGLENELIFSGFVNSIDGGRKHVWFYLGIVADEQLIPRLQLSMAPFDNIEEVDWEEMLIEFRSGNADSFTLLEGTVDEIKFEYLEVDSDQFEQWSNEWRNKYALPRLIRISFELTDDREVPWPELMVGPREHSYAIKEAS